jgi:hypothetical protein
MLEALCEHLLEKPSLYQDEMAVFLWDEFRVLVTTCSISRALASIRWSKKAARQIAKERNADLQDFQLYNLSGFRSYHLVYVDESGCQSVNGATSPFLSTRRHDWLDQLVRWSVQGEIYTVHTAYSTRNCQLWQSGSDPWVPYVGGF